MNYRVILLDNNDNHYLSLVDHLTTDESNHYLLTLCDPSTEDYTKPILSRHYDFCLIDEGQLDTIPEHKLVAIADVIPVVLLSDHGSSPL